MYTFPALNAISFVRYLTKLKWVDWNFVQELHEVLQRLETEARARKRAKARQAARLGIGKLIDTAAIGRKGGRARAAALSKEQLSEQGRNAVMVRWDRVRRAKTSAKAAPKPATKKRKVR